jgi:cytochrome c-type biogenesis protein CcmH
MMEALRLIVLVFVSLSAVNILASDYSYTFSTPQREMRYQSLMEELRCLVCQNQSLADSNAELAQDLRKKVYDMITTGNDDEEILDFLTDRYGKFILYDPKLNYENAPLWFLPILMICIGVYIISRVTKRGKHSEAVISQSVQDDAEALVKRLEEKSKQL